MYIYKNIGHIIILFNFYFNNFLIIKFYLKSKSILNIANNNSLTVQLYLNNIF